MPFTGGVHITFKTIIKIWRSIPLELTIFDKSGTFHANHTTITEMLWKNRPVDWLSTNHQHDFRFFYLQATEKTEKSMFNLTLNLIYLVEWNKSCFNIIHYINVLFRTLVEVIHQYIDFIDVTVSQIRFIVRSSENDKKKISDIKRAYQNFIIANTDSWHST